MRITVTKEYQDALRKAVEQAGSQSELSRRSGVGQSTINGIINKKDKIYMLDGIYSKLEPYVQPFMSNVTINGGENSFINAPRNQGSVIGKNSKEETATEFFDRIVKSDKIPDSIKVQLYRLLKEKQ